MNMINSLFSQFHPDTLSFLPLNLISSLIIISLISTNFTTNFFPGRIMYIWTFLRNNILDFIFQNAKNITNPWISLLSTTFFIILLINLSGLLPYTFSITSHVSFTYSIAIPAWLSINILGFYIAFNHRLSHLVPQGTPWLIIPLMIWIETLSLIAQPIALGLRLAANLTAGHLLLFLISTATWTLSNNLVISSITTIILILLFILEIGVACIQAYVFTSLLNFYLNQNI